MSGLDKVAAVSAARPELAMYPRFADVQASALTVTLNAGDVLYVPAYWCARHYHVQSLVGCAAHSFERGRALVVR